MKQKIALRIPGYASVFLLLAYLIYFMNRVDTSLIYYWQQSVAKTFGEALQNPGGVSKIFSDRFLELLANLSTGSISVAFLVLGLIISLAVVFREHRNNPIFYVLLSGSLIPFFLLFANYKFPFQSIMMIFTALVLTAIQSLYSPENKLVKFVYLFVSGIVLYLFTGLPGLIILLQLYLIKYFISKHYLEALSALSLLLIPVLYLPFNLSLNFKYAYLDTLIIRDFDVSPVYYIILFTPLLFFLLLKGLSFILSKFIIKKPALTSGALAILILFILFATTKSRINETDKNILKIEQACFNKEWDKVLSLATNLEALNRLVQFEINRALGNSGKLLDSLFWTPQPFAEKGLFLEDGNYTSRRSIYMSDFYYDLGYASETRHWGSEAQMVLMRHPLVLKNLIISCIAQGDLEFAEKYLAILSKSALYKDWCAEINTKISNNSIHKDSEIERLMVNNPEEDFFAGNAFPTTKLSAFYDNNRNNYLAFEFLIASYLLQNQVDLVVNNLDVFKRFGFENLPGNVEEALLIYMMKTKAENSPVVDFSIRQKTMDDFKDFNRLMIASRNMEDAKIKVSKYRRTYWYYFLFTSPYRSNL